MDARVLLVLVVASIDFLIAAIFYLQSRRDAARIAYALFALSVALWSWGVGFFLWFSNPIALGFLARFLYFAGGLIPPTFYYFALVFAENEFPSARKRFWIFLPTILFFVAYFFTNLIISGFSEINGVREFTSGPIRILFDIHLWAFFVLALRELLRKYRTVSSPTLKAQVVFITLGTYAVLAIAGVTNVILPLVYSARFIWIGPAATIIWVALVAYALLKHQLLNAKVIATEFFVSLIWLASVVETALSESSGELLRKFIILVVGVGLFGYFLIKSVLKEVRAREEIEKLAKDLETVNAELKRLDEAKSEFISLAGHQLRAPLTVIKGYTSMLLEGTFGEISKKALEALKRVFTSANNLTNLVSELLDLSRIETGRLKYEFKKIYFDDVIDEIVKEFKEVSGGKRIAIEFKNKNNKTFSVFGDREKLHEVVINLLDNALKYSEIGPIVLTLTPKSKSLLLAIADRGFGIPKDEMPRLFAKFGRTEIAKKERPGGMGLGLYFVKRIVDDHKGRIWAESGGIGKGSTFFVELPVK